MIVKPDQKLIYVMPDEDDKGVNIGEVDLPDNFVNIPLGDIGALIRRLREVARDMRGGAVAIDEGGE